MLSKEARRLGLTDVLPSGPKTHPTFSNKEVNAWKVATAGRDPSVEPSIQELGTIRWTGVYMKKLNPFGAGRFGEEMSLEELKAGLGVGGLPEARKYAHREMPGQSEKERMIVPGYPRTGSQL